jgi:quercetin dioxygenase-like cupin family protein
VRVVRFDAEVGRPVEQFGSDFRIAPLVGSRDGPVRVVMLHLQAGGSVGRHPAASRQLFAVVAGTGRVAGGDGIEQELGPGDGAVWEAGEEHGASSDEGLTAVVVEGTFSVDALLRTIEDSPAHLDPARAERTTPAE